MSCLESNLITWFAPRSNMIAPSSQGMTRPLNSMIAVPALIGKAANNPILLIDDFRFCHNRFRGWGLICFFRFFADGILLFLTIFCEAHTQEAERSNQPKPCGTTLRRMQTSMQQSSILQPRLAAFAPAYQGYPTTRWAPATALPVVANCVRYRDTIAQGRAPFPAAVPCAW